MAGGTPSASILTTLTRLIGARDLSIGVALGMLIRQGRIKETATVIVCGSILCFADVVAAWVGVGPKLAMPLGVGAAWWLHIGWMLMTWDYQSGRA